MRRRPGVGVAWGGMGKGVWVSHGVGGERTVVALEERRPGRSRHGGILRICKSVCVNACNGYHACPGGSGLVRGLEG